MSRNAMISPQSLLHENGKCHSRRNQSTGEITSTANTLNVKVKNKDASTSTSTSALKSLTRRFRFPDNSFRPGKFCSAAVLFKVLTLAVIGRCCQISEYYCDNRKCVSLDKFCNGIDDCGDGSDEPRHCSPCNRTYYGEVGGTYTISIHRPGSRDSQLPFVCQLTFAAGGSNFGDLVQIIFNSVTLGPGPHPRFSQSPPSCPGGHVTLNEPDRPVTAGHWCGHDWGQAVYFSDTPRVTLTLSLLPSAQSNPPGTFTFDFRLTYKFIQKEDASLRYGPPDQPYYRGSLLSGTFCSLLYDNCDKARCAVQSPNFPGLYPRNLTCYYAIRQTSAPPGHRALIQLSQEKEHLIHVRNRGDSPEGDSSLSMSSRGQPAEPASSSAPLAESLTIGDACDPNQDHVTIYDGDTMRVPLLLRFCGGGRFPEITSSGNDLLVVFYSAPTDFLLSKVINTAIQGFHIDVSIKYLPLGSHTYVENQNCLFTISSFQQKRGFLTSPQHSLPAKTTCTYLLTGSPGEIVWISLLKFHIGREYGKGGDREYPLASGLTQGTEEKARDRDTSFLGDSPSGNECNSTYFQIWQGTYSEKFNNATLLAHLCEDSPARRTCEFMLTSSPSSSPPRACHPEESFISKGPNMSLKMRAETSTVLRPVEFKLYYEFVDTRQEGEPFSHPQLLQTGQESLPNLAKFGRGGGNPLEEDRFRVEGCSRIFRTQNRAIQAATFTSPRNVFYFGRGGVNNLTCVYRFQGGRHERVKITFNRISMAGGFCKSELDPTTGRYTCRAFSRSHFGNDSSSSSSSSSRKPVTEGRVQLWEVPWNGNDSRVLKECLCDSESGPFTFISVSNTVDIQLFIRNMQPFHDQDHFAFEGRYEFIKHPDCSRPQRLKGPSGTITLKAAEKVPYQSCTHYPWEISPQSASHYVYLTVQGRTMKKYVVSGPQRKASFLKEPLTYKEVTSKEGGACESKSRILVHSGGFNGHLLYVICPSNVKNEVVQIYSPGWEWPNIYPNLLDFPNLALQNLPSSNPLIIELASLGPSKGYSTEFEAKFIQITRPDEPLNWAKSSPSSVVSSSGQVITHGKGHGHGQGANNLDQGGQGKILSGESSSSFISLRDEIEEDVCFSYKCPELHACISPSLFCDGVEHCPSGHDEADCEYFPVPKVYLVLAAASLITFVLLSCCFSCLVCKKRRAERREKLLMSSRTPTEEFFSGGSVGGVGGSSLHHQHLHSHHSHREIVC